MTQRDKTVKHSGLADITPGPGSYEQTIQESTSVFKSGPKISMGMKTQRENNNRSLPGPLEYQPDVT
jgi:hypothetical protein